MFEAVPHAFHAAETTGVATCVRKPLVATCSLDHSLCLWNAQDWCAVHTARIDCLGYQQIVKHQTRYLLQLSVYLRVRSAEHTYVLCMRKVL